MVHEMVVISGFIDAIAFLLSDIDDVNKFYQDKEREMMIMYGHHRKLMGKFYWSL